MPKITNENKEERNEMSNEMLMKCKNDIAKYGFGPKEYTQFLISVFAMKDETTVVKLSNDEIDDYRQKFLKKNECSVEDNFQLDKFKIRYSEEGGKRGYTGYFCPRSFWDSILSKQIR